MTVRGEASSLLPSQSTGRPDPLAQDWRPVSPPRSGLLSSAGATKMRAIKITQQPGPASWSYAANHERRSYGTCAYQHVGSAQSHALGRCIVMIIFVLSKHRPDIRQYEVPMV